MTISLIIPTYRRFDCLVETLNSLMECEKLPDEVIISDQNEPELFGKIDNEIRHHISNVRGSSIVWKHVYCDKVGTTGSRNFALKKAAGDIIIFTDDDVRYRKDFFENVLSSMTDDNVSMMGGVDYNLFPQPKPTLFKRLFMTLMGLNGTLRNKGSVSFGLFGKYPSNFDKPIPTEWAMGYCMIFRRQHLSMSGLCFDERLTRYGYGEDLEMTHLYYRWCKKHGLSCLLSPSVGVYHMVTSENRLNLEFSYLKVFVNRRYINSVFYGHSLFHKLLLWYSNLSYRVVNIVCGHGKEVSDAYRRYINIVKDSSKKHDVL